MKTNIKMRVTPEQSRKVQEICFKNNITWNGLKALDHIREPFIYICESRLSYDCKESKEYFNSQEELEIDADLFIRTNGTCEEISDDVAILEQKLKKKNEILKKARIKRRNQREELHKLNLELQKCIDLEEHNKIIYELKKDLLKNYEKLEYTEEQNKEMGRLVNLNASALVLVGQTKDLAMQKIEEQAKEIEKLKVVIEYLESKLK